MLGSCWDRYPCLVMFGRTMAKRTPREQETHDLSANTDELRIRLVRSQAMVDCSLQEGCIYNELSMLFGRVYKRRQSTK